MAAQVGYDFERSLSATSSLDSTAYGNATLPARKNTAASGYASPTHGGQGTTAEGSGTSSTTSSSHKNRRDEGSHYNAEDEEDYITSSSSYTTSDCRLHEPRVWEVMRTRGEGAPGTLQGSGIKKKTLPGEGGRSRTCRLASDLEEPRRHVTLKHGLLSTRLMSW
jgi:hypothetical protein